MATRGSSPRRRPAPPHVQEKVRRSQAGQPPRVAQPRRGPAAGDQALNPLDDAPAEGADGDTPAQPRQMPLSIVAARILVVSGMSFAAAFAIFFLVGALWIPSAIALGLTIFFLALMFAIERGAE